MGRGPIFIIGSMGSGTTLLRLMLDSHERIAIPHETGFMRAYRALQYIPFKWTGRGWARRLGWTDEEFDLEASRFFERMFMRYVEAEGKQRWGEKTPLHTWHVGAMARLFPDAVFVGILRHPGACTASNMTRFKHPLGTALVHYRAYNTEIARLAAVHQGRFVLLRYEDLVLQPEAAMRELLAWLGEPWSDRVLEHHLVQGSRERERIEGKSRADDPIDPARISKWTGTMDGPTRRLVGRELARLGEFFGYSMDDPRRLDPLQGRGSVLVAGEEIGARIDRFPDLDLRTRRPVPLFEQHLNPRKLTLRVNETGLPPRAPDPRLPAAVRRAVAPLVRRLPAATRRRLRTFGRA